MFPPYFFDAHNIIFCTITGNKNFISYGKKYWITFHHKKKMNYHKIKCNLGISLKIFG